MADLENKIAVTSRREKVITIIITIGISLSPLLREFSEINYKLSVGPHFWQRDSGRREAPWTALRCLWSRTRSKTRFLTPIFVLFFRPDLVGSADSMRSLSIGHLAATWWSIYGRWVYRSIYLVTKYISSKVKIAYEIELAIQVWREFHCALKICLKFGSTTLRT